MKRLLTATAIACLTASTANAQWVLDSQEAQSLEGEPITMAYTISNDQNAVMTFYCAEGSVLAKLTLPTGIDVSYSQQLKANGEFIRVYASDGDNELYVEDTMQLMDIFMRERDTVRIYAGSYVVPSDFSARGATKAFNALLASTPCPYATGD